VRLKLKIWRQAGPDASGAFADYEVDGANEEMSFVELLDLLNESLIAEESEPIAFESDCREGICGACGVMINGQAHGPERGTTTCQLHLRLFSDGDEIVVEPFRAAGFPLVKDLVVDRSTFDRIIQSGGYITAPTGAAPDANSILVPKDDADRAMDAAACIGCGRVRCRVPERCRPAVDVRQARPSEPLAAGSARACPADARDGGNLGAVLRFLHRPRRVRVRLPEGDQPRRHRDAPPRLPQSAARRMNVGQIDHLVALVSASLDAPQRRRIEAYAIAARRCNERIGALREELDRALRALEEAIAPGMGEADEVLRLAVDLDAAERIQPRIDSWLHVAIGAVSDDPGLEPFGEGPS
jgi:succinate dehydrogenase/fumarate reductase-like Fe-S protein